MTSEFYFLDASEFHQNGLLVGASYGSYRELMNYLSHLMPIQSYYWGFCHLGYKYLIESRNESQLLMSSLSLSGVRVLPCNEDTYSQMVEGRILATVPYQDFITHARTYKRSPEF